MSSARHGHRTPAELAARYQPNIFPAAWPVVQAWDELTWHPGAASLRSSQALAIDVFGTIRQSPDRDAVLDAVAVDLGLPPGGPWEVKLEWCDPLNLLKEAQPSPMDVVLRSPRVLLCVECKFCERDGGICQQTKLGKQPAQCTGHYAWQTNPRNGLSDRCALAAKGVRFWDLIPQVFTFRADEDHHPCPFAGPWYQWMRLMTIGTAVAQRERRQAAFAVLYVDGPRLPMARKDWSAFRAVLRDGPMTFHSLSFQRVLALAALAAPLDPVWPKLAAWVEGKVAQA